MDEAESAVLAVQGGVVSLCVFIHLCLRRLDSLGRPRRPWGGGFRGYAVLLLVLEALAGGPLVVAYLLGGWTGWGVTLVVFVSSAWYLLQPSRLSSSQAED